MSDNAREFLAELLDCSAVRCEVCGGGAMICSGCGKSLCMEHGHFQDLLGEEKQPCPARTQEVQQ